MSSGYNYLALNDDVYMYTGVTSISSDHPIIGFVLSDLRTKETKYYQVSGALEMTAQTSAEGAVGTYRIRLPSRFCSTSAASRHTLWLSRIQASL